MKIAVLAPEHPMNQWKWKHESQELVATIVGVSDFSENLKNFDGVIIFPEVFEAIRVNKIREQYLDYDKNINSTREHELRLLIDSGGWVCVLGYSIIHYWQGMPVFDTDIIKRYLNVLDVRSSVANTPMTMVKSKSDFFTEYIRQFGVTKLFYDIKSSEFVDDLKSLAVHLDQTTGFVYLNKIFILPFNLTKKNTVGIDTPVKLLVEAVLSYRSENEMQFPEWLSEKKFLEEAATEKLILETEQQLKKYADRLILFQKYKGILTAKGTPLASLVADILKDYFGLKIDNTDEGAEDIKIHDELGKLVCVVEVKSSKSSVKNDHIAQFAAHRMKSSLKRDFPGLLIMNSNCTVAGIEQRKKLYPSKEQVDLAEDQGIGILQTVDLLEYMFDLEPLQLNERSKRFLNDLIGKKGHIVFGRVPKA